MEIHGFLVLSEGRQSIHAFGSDDLLDIPTVTHIFLNNERDISEKQFAFHHCFIHFVVNMVFSLVYK